MLCHAGKHRLAGNGRSCELASRADQTSERGLWARAHHTLLACLLYHTRNTEYVARTDTLN